jgi:hypothetical protein
MKKACLFLESRGRGGMGVVAYIQYPIGIYLAKITLLSSCGYYGGINHQLFN